MTRQRLSRCVPLALFGALLATAAAPTPAGAALRPDFSVANQGQGGGDGQGGKSGQGPSIYDLRLRHFVQRSRLQEARKDLADAEAKLAWERRHAQSPSPRTIEARTSAQRDVKYWSQHEADTREQRIEKLKQLIEQKRKEREDPNAGQDDELAKLVEELESLGGTEEPPADQAPGEGAASDPEPAGDGATSDTPTEGETPAEGSTSSEAAASALLEGLGAGRSSGEDEQEQQGDVGGMVVVPPVRDDWRLDPPAAAKAPKLAGLGITLPESGVEIFTEPTDGIRYGPKKPDLPDLLDDRTVTVEEPTVDGPMIFTPDGLGGAGATDTGRTKLPPPGFGGIFGTGTVADLAACASAC